MSEYAKHGTTPINGQKQEEESFTYFFQIAKRIKTDK